MFFYYYAGDRAPGYSKYTVWSHPISAMSGISMAMVAALLKAGLKKWPFSPTMTTKDKKKGDKHGGSIRIEDWKCKSTLS